jgi:hypothetical protein
VKEMSSELSQVIVKMNGEINEIMERNLSPHFETIRVIESLLKQLPEFKRLEQENADLKKRLSLCLELSNLEMNNQADLELSNQEVQNDIQSYVPVSVQPVLKKNEIKLEIVETPSSIHPIVSEDELYKTVNLSNHIDNKLQTVAEEEEEESEEEEEVSAAEASEEEEADEEEVEEEEEASEADEEEEEEEEEVEEEEVEEEEVVEEEEEEEVEEEEVEEESGGEGLAELADSPEDGVEGAEPLEEVFIITIKGKGNFYTTNETNGDIYAIEGEDDVGDIVGKFVNKVATFN